MPPIPVPPPNWPVPPKHEGERPSAKATKRGKAAQREVNKANGQISRSGSSGKLLSASQYPMLDWATVESQVEWVTDLAAVITHTQVGASGTAIASIGVPISYAHALLDAHLASRDGMVYIRLYTVSFDLFVERLKADEEAEARTRIEEVKDTGVQLAIEQWLEFSGIET